jgi:protein AIR1/2
MYLYLSDEGKSKVISFREEKQKLKLGEGGEGYIANDEWCYNCGNYGHWGDVRLQDF